VRFYNVLPIELQCFNSVQIRVPLTQQLVSSPLIWYSIPFDASILIVANTTFMLPKTTKRVPVDCHVNVDPVWIPDSKFPDTLLWSSGSYQEERFAGRQPISPFALHTEPLRRHQTGRTRRSSPTNERYSPPTVYKAQTSSPGSIRT
jgi:hypothetical protein